VYWSRGQRETYLALQSSDLEGLKSLAGLVTVTNVLEGLGRILTSDI
jgi:hypothetical protein